MAGQGASGSATSCQRVSLWAFKPRRTAAPDLWPLSQGQGLGPWPWPLLLPLALVGGAAVAAELPLAALELALAHPACRQALKLSPATPAALLLQRDPCLATKIGATPACQPALGALQRLNRLERELQAIAAPDGGATSQARLRSRPPGDPGR